MFGWARRWGWMEMENQDRFLPYCFLWIFFNLKLFLGVLGLRYYVQTFSSCIEQRATSSARASQGNGFSCCGTKVLDHGHCSCRGMWDLPRPGIKQTRVPCTGWWILNPLYHQWSPGWYSKSFSYWKHSMVVRFWGKAFPDHFWSSCGGPRGWYGGDTRSLWVTAPNWKQP